MLTLHRYEAQNHQDKSNSPTINLARSMAYIRAFGILPHVAGINEILAYSRLPKQKVMQHMKETKRIEFSLSAIIPNIGEKIICPRASAATIKPYSSKLTRLSSYKLEGSFCICIMIG